MGCFPYFGVQQCLSSFLFSTFWTVSNVPSLSCGNIEIRWQTYSVSLTKCSNHVFKSYLKLQSSKRSQEPPVRTIWSIWRVSVQLGNQHLSPLSSLLLPTHLVHFRCLRHHLGQCICPRLAHSFETPLATVLAVEPPKLVSTLYPSQEMSEPAPKLHLTTCFPGPFLLPTVLARLSRKQHWHRVRNTKGLPVCERRRGEVGLDGCCHSLRCRHSNSLSAQRGEGALGQRSLSGEAPYWGEMAIGLCTTILFSDGLRASTAWLRPESWGDLEGAISSRLSANPIRWRRATSPFKSFPSKVAHLCCLLQSGIILFYPSINF